MVAATLPSALARARALVEPALATAVGRLDTNIARVVRYQLGWTDRNGRPVHAPRGKAIRPALTILSAELSGADPEVAVPGAVAIELVHNFSLLHDDVMDGDRTRRHRETAWSAFGTGAAICAGDALLVLAHELLVEQPTAPRIRAASALASATQEMIAGQAEDLATEGSLQMDVEAYLSIAARKTGSLMGCACALGAILAGAPHVLVETFSSFGRALGLVFQGVDDLLGIWGRPEITGKPLASDVRRCKPSLPILTAIASGGAEARELQALLARRPLDEAGIARALALIEASGAHERTRAFVTAGQREACQRLEQLPDAPARDALAEITQFIVTREC